MKQVLLVEDSKMFGQMTKTRIEQFFDVPVFWTKNLEETIKLLKVAKDNFTMALLDFNLPDAPNGEVIDEVINRGISSIVFTSNISDEVREQVWSKKVADYILKDDPSCLEYIISAMQRLQENQNNLVLVVDDSKSFRTMISELLYVHRYRVLNATSGESALEILEKHPEIQLIISDYNMPGMNGCSLCQKVRERHKMDELAFIGISSASEQNIGARFIKSGANDFIIKQSFLVEEFYSRINNCLENLKLIRKIKDAAIKDFMTGLYNRRYFFDVGDKLFKRSKKENLQLSCVMLDIDFFKRVNDTYGHDIGDMVIKKVAALISADLTNKDIVARFGGEEFCFLISSMNKNDLFHFFDVLRKNIEITPVAKTEDDTPVNITVSIGICTDIPDSLDEMIKIADTNLYQAKQSGRNRVV